jgi:hypothetical protein
MDDTSIQHRIRLAQINGIKLDEASSKKRLSGQGSEFGQNIERTKENQNKNRASALGMYHAGMAENIGKGMNSEAAHNATLKGIKKAHGPEGLAHVVDHLGQHFYVIGKNFRDNTD